MIRTLYFSRSNDPVFNLAAERALLDITGKDEEALFLYINSPSVIIGRYQNPLVECSPDYCIEKKIPFIRRFSGGGTVYHDPGNLNYCFIGRREDFIRSRNTEFLAGVFIKNGINAKSGPRGDLFLKGRKFSGNAFRYIREKVLHHGTLLADADLDVLRKCISRERPPWIISRGIESVHSSVCNISDFYPGTDCGHVSEMLKKEFDPGKTEFIEDLPEIADHAEKYMEQLLSAEWRWGASPMFSVLSDSGEILFTVKNGMISGASGKEFSVLPAEFCRETLIKLRENIDDGIYLKPVEKLLGWAGFMF